MAYEKTNWQLAEETLASIGLKRKSRASQLFRLVAKLTNALRSEPHVTAFDAEERALALQIRMAREFIQLRREAHQKLLAKPDWPEEASLPQSPEQKPNYVSKSLLDLVEEITNADIPPKAKEDMLADYWNKWAFITWERALKEEENSDERWQWLGYVERYLELIGRDPDRATWTPWQMSRVRLELARSLTPPPKVPGRIQLYRGYMKRETAENLLKQILGSVPSAPQPTAPTAPDNTAQIADTIAKMSEVPDPIAIASNLRRAYPGLSQESLGKITALLAGRIHPALLDLIFRQYSNCQ
jgi:hypothetical protein